MLHGLAGDQLLPLGRADVCVIALGLDAQDLVHGDEMPGSTDFHHRDIRGIEALCTAVHGGGVRADHSHRAHDGPRETLRLHRLEQIIEGVDLEGPDRVPVVRGHKNRAGRIFKGVEQLEAAAAGHLDVEEQQLGPEFRDGREGGGLVRRLAHELQIRADLDETPQVLAREALVIDDHAAHRSHRPGVFTGISISATTRSPSCARRKLAASP